MKVNRVLRCQLAVLGTVVAVVAASSCAGEREVTATKVPGEVGFLYDIDGNLIYLECSGSGRPTIVLEAGLGGDHRDWRGIVGELESHGRVCGYDRSGIAYSQNGAKRATAREKVSDLHDLLEAAEERGPYVLVGHSFSGMLARLYASKYPSDVAGLVLVDSSSPDQEQRFRGALPRSRPGESRELRELRSEIFAVYARNPEGVDWQKSSAQAGEARSLGDVPLIVITAGQSDAPPGPYAAQFARIWLSLQQDLAQLSENAIHVIASNSGHVVMSNLGQPELVLQAIREVVAAVREERALRRCESVFPAPGRDCLLSS